ncbi:unnamed protein product [Closterium sp. Naga37s-1]|nr:unnamed protein product [Closterium sp. Naga37s-1]
MVTSSTSQHDSSRASQRIMVRLVDRLSRSGFCEQMIDAFVFSLASYETSDDTVSAILQSTDDLPGGALDLLHLDSFPGGRHPHEPVMVGRSTHGHVVVACRGTADVWDVVQDLKYFPRNVEGVASGGTAHAGFVERAERVPLQPFLDLLAAGHCLVFTGHSLGGAVASLLTLRFVEAAEQQGLCTHGGRVQCITFGSPLFASPDLADVINDKHRDVYCHVVSKHDLIPRLLPLVSLVQRLKGRGAAAEALEAFRLVRVILGVVQHATHLPIANMLHAAESLIPPPIRLLLTGAIQLLWPSRTPDQYAFAGNFLFLDPAAHCGDTAVHLVKAECLSEWPRQMGFALSLNFNFFTRHLMASYQQGVAKGIRSSLLSRLAVGGIAAAAVTRAGLSDRKKGTARAAELSWPMDEEWRRRECECVCCRAVPSTSETRASADSFCSARPGHHAPCCPSSLTIGPVSAHLVRSPDSGCAPCDREDTAERLSPRLLNAYARPAAVFCPSCSWRSKAAVVGTVSDPSARRGTVVYGQSGKAAHAVGGVGKGGRQAWSMGVLVSAVVRVSEQLRSMSTWSFLWTTVKLLLGSPLF